MVRRHARDRRGGRLVAGLLAGSLVIVGCSSGSATAEETPQGGERPVVNAAAFQDPVTQALWYGITSGKVTSDEVEVKLNPVTIAQGLSALGTDRYDMLSVSSVAVGKLAAQLPLMTLGTNFTEMGEFGGNGMVVPRDSDIKSFEDLRGRTVGVSSLGAANTIQTQLAIEEATGIKLRPSGGDATLVELPVAQLMSALKQGEIDAAYLYFASFYAVKEDPEIRDLGSPLKVFHEEYGFGAPVSLWATTVDLYDEKAEQLHAVFDLLAESKQYYFDHADEVNAELARAGDVDENYVPWVLEDADIGNPWTPETLEATQKFFDLCEEKGFMENPPSIESIAAK
jgi:sulfonate transport system substrate-binding protein